MLSATHVLATVESQRLLKAVEGLVSGALAITLTHADEAEIRGFCRNGDGREYGVVLAGVRTFCSCPDHMHRGVICKHQVALCLYAIRNPKTAISTEEDIPPAQSLPVSPVLDTPMNLDQQRSYNLSLCRSRREHGERRAS
jgi:predicted nucleic acid-binding Zn finger protein